MAGRSTRDREVASLTPGQCTIPGNLGQLSLPLLRGIGKLSTNLLAGVKAGRVHSTDSTEIDRDSDIEETRYGLSRYGQLQPYRPVSNLSFLSKTVERGHW